jgi:predicted phage terminase large subunit-like protein
MVRKSSVDFVHGIIRKQALSRLPAIEKLKNRLQEPPRNENPLSLVEFTNIVYPRYQWYTHSLKLASTLQRVADGELKRLMVFMPPRNGKSLLTSKIFSAYCLYRHPEKWVGLASYAAELAYTFSRSARDAYLQTGGVLRDDAYAVKNWENPYGGGLWAAGVGGPITGKGFSVGVLDDPLKNQEEAFSQTIRDKQKEWYKSTFYTRGEPDAAIVIVLTRWHEDDLAGWLLDQERKEDEPEHWHIVNFEAIKEQNAIAFPATCTVEPDWRSPGEALCPERFPLSKLLKIAAKVGAYFWNALFQQRPSPATGNIFNRNHWQYWTELPARPGQWVLSVDASFKNKADSDFVAIQVWFKTDGRFYLVDQVRDRMSFTATVAAIRQMCNKHPKCAAKLVEDKANGSAVIDTLRLEIPGLIPINPTDSKVARARAVSPFVEAGNVYLPQNAPWVGDFIEEMSSFPNGANDDQVDCLSMALRYMQGAVDTAAMLSKILA